MRGGLHELIIDFDIVDRTLGIDTRVGLQFRLALLPDHFVTTAGGRKLWPQQTFAQRIELQFAKQRRQQIHIHRLPNQRMQIDTVGNIHLNGHQSFAQKRLFGELLQTLLLLALQIRCVGQQILHAAILRNQFLRGLRTNARNAGDIVTGVAHQPQDIDHLINSIDAPFLEHLRFGQNLHLTTLATGFVNADPVANQLIVILVRRHHRGLETIFGGLVRHRADHIVGFVSGASDDRNSKRLQ